MPEGDAAQSARIDKAPAQKFGQGFVLDCWYFAALSSEVTKRLKRHELLGEPVLLGRNAAGKVFAMRDICPHRAAPLSAGKLVYEPDGAERVDPSGILEIRFSRR